MKTSTKLILGAVLWTAMFLSPATLPAQGTAFTYQGRLDSGGAPANGLYDFRAQVYNRAVAGDPGDALVSSTLTLSAVPVTNGLFVLNLDFGDSPFNGEARWLLLAVRTNGGGAFTSLTPRQALTATPYAILAGNVSGVIPNSSLPANPAFSGTVSAGSFAGNGAGLTDLNASQLTSGTVPAAALGNAWRISGNAGITPGTHFVGTTDNQPLEVRVNNQRALRLQPDFNSPSLVGGFPGNSISGAASGSVIAGGGASGFTNTIAGAAYSVIGGGRNNRIVDTADALIGGGAHNRIESAFRSAVVGGDGNVIGTNATRAFIGGGLNNNILSNSYSCLIAGGQENQVGPNADASVIGGGANNSITPSASYATIPGGRFNSATNNAFAAGTRAKANHTGAFVWADAMEADFVSTTNNQFNVRASGGIRLATSGAGMTLDGQPVTTGTNYARLNVNQTFTATNLFTQPVGLGVTTPLRALHIRDLAGGNGGDVQIGSTSADGVAKLIHFGDAFGGSGSGFVSIGESGADDRMVITAGTFVFTNLSQQGRVGIGRLPTANKLEVEGDASKSTAGSWLANSDARIKQDITPVTGALEKLEQVRLVSFRYTDAYRAEHPGVEDRRYLNVVAQEFRDVFPEHVKSSGEKLSNGSEILQVDTYPLTIYTAAAVQELHRALRRRDAENAELRARLEKLERLLESRVAGGAR